MKKTLLILLFTGVSGVIAHAQTNARIGLMIAPGWSYRAVSGDVHPQTMEFLKSFHTNKFGGTIALTGEFYVSPRWSVELGAGFTRNGFGTREITVKEAGYEDSIYGFGKTTIQFDWASAQAGLRFHAGAEGTGFTTAFSMMGMWMLRSKLIMDLRRNTPEGTLSRDEYPLPLEDFNTFNLMPGISAGWEWKAKKLFAVRLEAYGALGLIPYDDSPVSTRPWQAGIRLGVNFGK